MVRSNFEKRRASRRARSRLHDPEETTRRGMSSEGVAEDEAETMASTGDSSNSFQEIASGTATGLGVDRGESVGTGGLAAGEDLDEVAEGDYWRQNFERNPYREAGHPYDQYTPGERLGWQAGAGLDPREEGAPEIDHPVFRKDESEK